MKTWKEVLQIISGKSQKMVENPNGHFPIYGSGGLMGYADDYLCEPGTTIVGRKGTINKPIFVNERFWNVDTAFGISPGRELNPLYLFYFCQSFNFKSLDKSTTIPSLAKSDLLEIEMPVPTLAEQEHIVAHIEELFSQLDSGVETLKKTKQQLEVYRKAILQQAFTPKDNWTTKSVSEIGEVNLGRQRSPQKVAKDYPTKYIRAANITEAGICVDDILEMEFTPVEREKYELKDGDIVLSEASGSPTQVGKPAIWRNELPHCCFQNTVIRHRVTTELPEYVFWYYKYLYSTGYFASVVGGVGINHLGAKNFSGIILNIAPQNEQRRIVDELEKKTAVCDRISCSVDLALLQAENMRQSILRKAFEDE